MNKKLLASDIIGNVTNPWEIVAPGAYSGEHGEGLITLMNNLLKTAVAVAGIFAFINIIIAGYGFMSAGGNPDKITESWSKIWQSILGLVIVVGSFILAAVVGIIVYNDWTAIINPRIYGPNT